MIEMKNNKSKNIFYILLLLISIVMISFGFMGDDRSGTKPFHPLYKSVAVQETGKVGDAYAMNINNIYLPLNRKGIIADVNVEPPAGMGSGGQFGGNIFLFSSGFFLSGFADGQLWSNAVASASLVEDYQPGTVAGGQGDPNAVLYVLSSQEEDFGPGWQDWIDAVGLGADFYDGDGDGVYTPVDKNGNGVWDPDEDRPDLIGDETVWCVYSDGIPAAQRRWNTVPPYGIEIRQTVFAFDQQEQLVTWYLFVSALIMLELVVMMMPIKWKMYISVYGLTPILEIIRMMLLVVMYQEMPDIHITIQKMLNMVINHPAL
jgi:hypothetical protein